MRAQTADIPYIDIDGIQKTVTATAITGGSSLGDGWYYVLKNTTVAVSSRIIVNTATIGTHLILEDNCEFTANGGIQVEGSNKLTIYGQSTGSGKLTAQATSLQTGIGDGAGISLGQFGTNGSVTITGGTVMTQGSNDVSPLPTNGNNSVSVYLNALELSNAIAVTPVTAGSINGTPCANTPVAANGVYGIKDMQTDVDGKVYFYLPETGNSGANPETIWLADGSNNYYQETFARPANNSNTPTLNTGADTRITAADIGGVTAPVAGNLPSITITTPAPLEYAATMEWNPADNPFAPATGYTATITLAPKTGYTLVGVAADFFTVTDATTVANSADSGVVTAMFPATAAAGETVTLTVYPASGYELRAISVFKTGDVSVSVALNGFNGFNGSFTMPDYAVTVYASFTEIPPPEPDPDAVALENIVYAIRNLHVIVPQEDANMESEVAYWLRDYLARLFEDKGWDITVQKLTVVNFFPATAGTRTDVPGANGSFSGEKIFNSRKETGEAFFTVPASGKAVIVRGSSGWTRKTVES
ncbi:hypothetical protein FACS189435_3630 [Bacteroidia bacterium]|nr:hypothetical protein FACS189435_3630 [Bacteroidia bacterium]